MSRTRNYRKCKQYMNKQVRIKTTDGRVYQGTIVKLDKHRVYLRVSRNQTGNKASVSFFPFLLPLVLFDLLVIVLLERPFFRRF
ncbi:hypothetical protein N0M98_06245 [Paenibacillus doosanensis]|uniref:LSM domain-containing protein n=1 Tax=Paenibacillus doosanensis TaxID=1229154 RepID=UPI0021801C9C|nr:LSM domain-containing protein [Paenibacillus doosanensis]MCS7459737.1 hypothetical protein [Paenibacillus doosanensis]